MNTDDEIRPLIETTKKQYGQIEPKKSLISTAERSKWTPNCDRNASLYLSTLNLDIFATFLQKVDFICSKLSV